MNQEKYSVIRYDDFLTYEFLSQGPKGAIKKLVSYQEIDDNLFNLAFGDWDEVNRKMNDAIRSNNNDRNKVLLTVAFTAIDFIQHWPNATLLIKGSTESRTRLYQIKINNNWNEIIRLFDIKGFYNGYWEPFKKEKNYESFLLKAK